MGAAKKLRIAMLDKEVSAADIAVKTGKAIQTVYNALVVDNFKWDNLVQYADALDCDVMLVDRKTGKMY